MKWITQGALIALTLVCIPIDAQTACTVELTAESERGGRRHEIHWTTVPGASLYVLEESADDFRTVHRREWSGANPPTSIDVSYDTTSDLPVRFRITVSGPGIIPCTSALDVSFSPDPRFQQQMQKSIIPLVGSTPGINGADFRTSLRLRATEHDQRGLLVLRLANLPASSRDAAIPYALARKGDVVDFGDVMQAFGAVGLGSIDVIPDPTAGGGFTVPYAEVRLFNVSPNGTFGTMASQTQAWAWAAERNPLSVVVPDASLRLNLGVRAVSDSIVFLQVRRNNTVVRSQLLTIPPNTLAFGSANGLTEFDLQPGDVISFTGSGTFIPMYTLTDNSTNDPALFVPPTKIDFDVSSYAVRR